MYILQGNKSLPNKKQYLIENDLGRRIELCSMIINKIAPDFVSSIQILNKL